MPCGGFLTLLGSAVAATNIFSREQLDVPELVKTLTAAYSPSISTFPFQWLLHSCPARRTIQKRRNLSWQLVMIFIVPRGIKRRNLPRDKPKGKTTYNSCCRRSIPVLVVLQLRFLVHRGNKRRNLSSRLIKGTPLLPGKPNIFCRKNSIFFFLTTNKSR